MQTLEWWPAQSHHLLESDGRTLTAGETFEASDEDAELLLASPEFRLPEPKTKPAKAEKTDDTTATTATHSPDEAQRETTT